MKIIIVICSFVCLLNWVGRAQSDFRPGFVVTLQQDTLPGLVAFQGNKHNSLQCKFKPSRGEFTMIYNPTDLTAYGFTDGRFYLADTLPESGDPAKVVFFELMVSGKASLLRYNSRLFVKNDEGLLKELKQVDEVTTISGKRGIITKKEYIGVLNVTFRDCATIGTLAQQNAKAGLLPKQIVPLFEQYNDCVQADYQVFNTKQPWVRVSAGLYRNKTKKAYNCKWAGQ